MLLHLQGLNAGEVVGLTIDLEVVKLGVKEIKGF